MTPEEIRAIDPSQIESLTMTSGSVYRVKPGNQCKRKICQRCNLNNNLSQANNQQGGNIILRAKKDNKIEEDNGEEKVEETVEIDVEAQPKEENGKKEVLRGKDGKPLLIDIITGGKFDNEEQPQSQEQPLIDQKNNQQNIVQPQQEQDKPQYYDQQGLNQNDEQQLVPEQNEEMNNNIYEDQYNDNVNQDPNIYPQEQNQPIYPPQEMNNANVQEEYVDPNMVNQNNQEAYVQVPEVNVPGEEEGYQNQNEPYYEPNQGQENIYPNFENDQQNQQQEYGQPINSPQEQNGYYQETQPEIEQPFEPSTQQPVEPPVQPIDPQIQPQMQPPVQPTIEPPVQTQTPQQVPPTMEPPVQPQIQPPVQPTVQPPSQTQIPPQAPPTMKPPVQPHIPPQFPTTMQPPARTQFPPTVPGKGIPTQNYPKKPMVQVKFGIGLPKIGMPGMMPRIGFPQHLGGPHGPHGPHGHEPHFPHGHEPHGHPHSIGFIPPVQQPKAFGPGGKRIVFNPVQEMINVVHNVMAPIAGISAGRMVLRSNKPTTAKKTAQKEVPQGDETQQGPVLRARRNIVNYESKVQTLCPECTAEEYNNYYGYGQYGYNNNSGYKTNYSSQTYQTKSRGFSDNFNFHEIVETSDNSKSYVVAKKGGVIVSTDH